MVRFNKTPDNSHHAVIDLFCGAGGMTHGFLSEGFNVVAGLDSDPHCRYPYEHNNGAFFIEKPIEDVSAEELLAFYPEGSTKILVGCAPCQPYSRYNQKPKRKDEEWKLLSNFSDMIEAIKPDVVSMENVPELERFDKGKVFIEFVERLKHAGYWVWWKSVFCADYGIPQNRTRLVLLASQHGAIELIPETHTRENYVTVEDVIRHLPPLEAGSIFEGDLMHRSRGLSEINLRRIRQSVPGGTWRDWDDELRAACHRKATGRTYPSVYGRMKWDEPAPTITTQFFGYGNGRFGHPEQDRAISLREGAIIQTFPENYEFVEPGGAWSMQAIGRLIGNAVPVTLGRVIARSISLHLKG